MDYGKHADALDGLTKSQSADSDNRDAGREAHLFIEKRDGQWEPYWWNLNEGKPRYTFDMTGPIVDQVAGELEQADFDIVVKPAGGASTKDDAKILDGLVRNIENISNAKDIYNLAGRNMITAGIDGWQIAQKFVDDDSFEQDLVIEPIANFIDSVWFGPFKLPDASDAPWCMVLEAMPKGAYDDRWSEGSGQSISEDRLSEAYYNKEEHVIVGQLYYIKQRARELWLMSDGGILENTEKNQMVRDEMAQAGVTVVKTRKRNKNIVMSRLLDGGDWLAEAQETVFNQIPVIPTIGNFKIFENKLLYRGVVEKLYDAQRVFNYSMSREIEEGALAPRAKYWATLKQTAGHEDSLRTLNTNADPVQHYTPDPAVPGAPQQQGGAAINPGLRAISESMNGVIRQTGGLYAANMGDNPNAQSGVAIKRLQDKGDTGTIKYFKAQERAICRTARILIDAIPVVYDTARQVRILKEDGSFDMKVLNQSIQDKQVMPNGEVVLGAMVTVNDVSKGKYDVTCSAGPSFQNRQEETVAAMTEMVGIMPEIMKMGGDLLFKNLNSPGMDLLAERLREQLYKAGQIPFEQQTDEEKQQTQQAQQQPPPEDPGMVLAKAEAGKAEAQGQKVQVDAMIAQSREQRENFKAEQAAQKQQFDQMFTMMTGAADQLATQANTLKVLREALGIDTAAGPTGLAAIVEQSGLVLETQRKQ